MVVICGPYGTGMIDALFILVGERLATPFVNAFAGCHLCCLSSTLVLWRLWSCRVLTMHNSFDQKNVPPYVRRSAKLYGIADASAADMWHGPQHVYPNLPRDDLGLIDKWS